MSAPATNPHPAYGKPVDIHVHAVGVGAGGTGCWLRLRAWQRPLISLMLTQLGLPWGALQGDLDRLYIELLLKQVRTSSLGAVVLLAYDDIYDEHGRAIEGFGTFYVPNTYVLDLGRRYPEFLPGVSIHPGRPDALEELAQCLARGAALLKLLPIAQNIDCSAHRFQRFWERMAEARLPLLVHTGGEHTVRQARTEFADPRRLQLPLECGVNVIAAHCGTKSGLLDPDYFPVFCEMIAKYSNLYGDSSAFTVPIRGRRVRQCTQEPLAGRILHGSDFPVPVLGHWSWVRGYIGWKDFRNSMRTQNLLERDYQLKRAMGFSEQTFCRVWRFLRPRPA